MTLDELLSEIRVRQLLLISADEIWPSPRLTKEIVQAIEQHRAGLRLLMKWSSIETCPARDLHRRYWKYAGGGCYVCTACQRLFSWLEGHAA